MDKYLLEDGTGYYALEHISGNYLLEDGGGIGSSSRAHNAQVVWRVLTRRDNYRRYGRK